ncbi:MAG: ATP-binding protein [Sulfuricellaceae bacterium]
MHYFENFKNFAAAELDLFRPMTLMIGKNGSGKSNIIEAVELLAQIAHGRPLYEITDIGRGSGATFEIRGGLPGCLKYDMRENQGLISVGGPPIGKFSLGFSGSYGNKKNFDYKVTVRLTPAPKIVEEVLIWDNRQVFRAQAGKNKDILDVEYDNFRRGGNKPITHLPSDCSVLSRYATFVDLIDPHQHQKDTLGFVKNIRGHLNAAFVFDLIPKQMRGLERIGQEILIKDGSNLSPVLFALSQGDEAQQNTLARILEKIRQVPEEPFVGFDFITTTQQQDVQVGFKRVDGSIADARTLSDGTLRALAILTALETVPESSRIVIEEMDNGIHPTRVKTLIDAVWECSKRRKLNVLATTHNPATLDCLSDEQLKSVVICYRDHPAKTSRLIPFLGLPRSDVLMEQGRLGDLVTRQVLEKHLLPGFEKDQHSKAKAWLESLT